MWISLWHTPAVVPRPGYGHRRAAFAGLGLGLADLIESIAW